MGLEVGVGLLVDELESQRWCFVRFGTRVLFEVGDGSEEGESGSEMESWSGESDVEMEESEDEESDDEEDEDEDDSMEEAQEADEEEEADSYTPTSPHPEYRRGFGPPAFPAPNPQPPPTYEPRINPIHAPDNPLRRPRHTRNADRVDPLPVATHSRRFPVASTSASTSTSRIIVHDDPMSEEDGPPSEESSRPSRPKRTRRSSSIPPAEPEEEEEEEERGHPVFEDSDEDEPNPLTRGLRMSRRDLLDAAMYEAILEEEREEEERARSSLEVGNRRTVFVREPSENRGSEVPGDGTSLEEWDDVD